MKRKSIVLGIAVALVAISGTAFAGTGAVSSSSATPGDPVWATLLTARQGTAKYHDVHQAIKDGYHQVSACVMDPSRGVMGIHYLNDAYAKDPRILAAKPELLLYDSPTGGLDPVTSNTIIELIMKQRDVYRTSSLLVTHRLQDAFTLATHEFDQKTNQLKSLPRGQYCEIPMSFLILRDGKVTFDGDIHQLAHTKDEYIREYIS